MKIILASQSPRRKFLLERMGIKFDTIPSNFDEYFDDSRSVVEIVKELGLGKAEDVAKDNPDAIVIGGDLIVVLDGKQLGKPEGDSEAKQMLRDFSGRTHRLITSVAIICKDKGYVRAETDECMVTFKELTDEFIDEYVATGTTNDKAGGYAIQHHMVKPFIENIEGRMDTIIGLPTNLVAEMLGDFGIDVKALDMTDQKLLNEDGFID